MIKMVIYILTIQNFKLLKESKLKIIYKLSDYNVMILFITIVNAKRANKGRIENKEKLIEKSNIQELKNILLSELKLTDNYIVINKCNSRNTKRYRKV